jgi:serine/threonine-protein kinase
MIWISNGSTPLLWQHTAAEYETAYYGQGKPATLAEIWTWPLFYPGTVQGHAQRRRLMTLIQAKKKIRNAWIAGLISGFITLIFTLVAATSEGGAVNIQGTTASIWNLLDVFLTFLFTFGIYMKSRVAAIGMFIYFLIGKLAMWATGPSLPGILIGVVFMYFYFEGARGAITYHQLRQSYAPDKPVTAPPED